MQSLIHVSLATGFSLFSASPASPPTQLKELQAKPVTAKIIDGAKASSGQRFALKDLLNVPMQRILKYHFYLSSFACKLISLSPLPRFFCLLACFGLRFARYPLLLKELIKNTPDGHPDKVKLHQALAAVQDLAK
jgi:hypothetical protein